MPSNGAWEKMLIGLLITLILASYGFSLVVYGWAQGDVKTSESRLERRLDTLDNKVDRVIEILCEGRAAK